MFNSYWGRAATGKKKSYAYVCRVASVVSNSVTLWTMAGQTSLSGRGFSSQEYWSVLADTGYHTLLEHYISGCLSCQLPWVPGAARTPKTQAAAPPPHLAHTGANPNPPWQPHEQTPVGNPYPEVEVKAQLKPRGSVTKDITIVNIYAPNIGAPQCVIQTLIGI